MTDSPEQKRDGSNNNGYSAGNNSGLARSRFESTFWKIIGAGVAALALVGTFNLAIMIVDRNPPMRFISRAAIEKDVPQGGVLNVDFSLERYRVCKSDIDRWLIDSDQNKHAISSYTTALNPILGYTSDSRQITIPVAAAKGPAHYYLDIKYYCNWLQRALEWPIIIRSPDVDVNITPYVIPETGTLTPSDIKDLKQLVPKLKLWDYAEQQNKLLMSPIPSQK